MIGKRSVSLMLAALMLSSVALFAQNSLDITSASGAAGSSVTVYITATADEDISAAEFTLGFDQTVLQIATPATSGVTVGPDATGWTIAALGDQEVTDANTSGSIIVSALDLSTNSPVASGTDKRLVKVVFEIASGAANGDVALSLGNASLANTSEQDLTITTSDGTVTVSPAQTGDENKIWVQDVTGSKGGTVTAQTMLNTDTDLYGLQFDITFDNTILQIKPVSEDGVTLGSGAGGLTIPVIDEDAVTAANSDGRLVVMMVDLTLEAPLTAGTEKQVLDVKFAISEDATVGDATIGLANVSASGVEDTLTVEVTLPAEDGTLSIQEFKKGDLSGDGTVNIFDLLDLLRILGGKGEPSPAQDVNADGKTDIFDLLELLRVLSGKA